MGQSYIEVKGKWTYYCRAIENSAQISPDYRT
jgi:transposase-like protein